MSIINFDTYFKHKSPNKYIDFMNKLEEIYEEDPELFISIELKLDNKIYKILKDCFNLKKEHLLYHRIFSEKPKLTLKSILKDNELNSKKVKSYSGSGGYETEEGSFNYVFFSCYVPNVPLDLTNITLIFGRDLLYSKPSWWSEKWGGAEIQNLGYKQFIPYQMKYKDFKNNFNKKVNNFIEKRKNRPYAYQSTREIVFESSVSLDYLVCILVSNDKGLYFFGPNTKYETIEKFLD
jgi:hypothetical protein